MDSPFAGRWLAALVGLAPPLLAASAAGADTPARSLKVVVSVTGTDVAGNAAKAARRTLTLKAPPKPKPKRHRH
jgi:hypothetical protein